MKRVVHTILINLIFSATLTAQGFIVYFQDAIIFKKNKDSIVCKVQVHQVNEREVSASGETLVIYKLGDNPKELSIKISEIQSIETGHSKYLTVPVDRRELLFKVAVEGKLSLLEYPRISIIHSGPPSGGTNKFGPKEITYYAIKTSDKTVVIKVKKDLNAFMELIEGCPEAKAIANKKIFQIENVPILVTKLNECK
jgi:hypothetical protein